MGMRFLKELVIEWISLAYIKLQNFQHLSNYSSRSISIGFLNMNIMIHLLSEFFKKGIDHLGSNVWVKKKR